MMPRMTLKAVHRDSERRRLPLSERIIDENLGSFRHVPRKTATPLSEDERVPAQVQMRSIDSGDELRDQTIATPLRRRPRYSPESLGLDHDRPRPRRRLQVAPVPTLGE